jgi:hypothetical protein
MTSKLLNQRQAHWAMFLSEYDFKLDWAPGKDNVANAGSRRADYDPQKGDKHLTGQHQTILMDKHTELIIA